MGKRKLIIACLIIEFLFYFLFLWLDLCPWWIWNDLPIKKSFLSNSLKFAGIVVCFLISCFIYKNFAISQKEKDTKKIYIDYQKDSLLQVVALGCTILADICLLLTEQYTLGIGIFLIIQTIYLYRIQKSRGLFLNKKVGKACIKRILLRFLIGIGVLLVLNKYLLIDFQICLAVIYFINFTDNLFLLIRFKNSLKNGLFHYSFFLWGMLLFYLCDIHVGIFNLSSVLQTIPKTFSKFVSFASVAMWLFYLPAQVLLSMSGGNFYCDISTKR